MVQRRVASTWLPTEKHFRLIDGHTNIGALAARGILGRANKPIPQPSRERGVRCFASQELGARFGEVNQPGACFLCCGGKDLGSLSLYHRVQLYQEQQNERCNAESFPLT